MHKLSLVPIPYEWAGFILMGIGISFWFLALFDFFNWANARIKGKDVGKTIDWSKEEFVPNTLRRRLKGYLLGFLIGFGFFFFGYVLYANLFGL